MTRTPDSIFSTAQQEVRWGLEPATRTKSQQDQLTLDYKYLVFHAVRKAARPHPYMEREDFEGVALRGLVKASRSWDPKLSRFQTHAIHVMSGEIMHEMRDRSEVPGWLYEACGKMGKAIDRLFRRGVFDPTDEQIAEELGVIPVAGNPQRRVTAEMVAHWRAWNPQPAISLESGVGEEDNIIEAGKCRALISRSCDRDFNAEIVVRETMKVLSPRQQAILYLRYWKGWSQTEIAHASVFSCNYISYMEKQGLKRLRTLLARTFSEENLPEVVIPIQTRHYAAGMESPQRRWKEDPADPILALAA